MSTLPKIPLIKSLGDKPTLKTLAQTGDHFDTLYQKAVKHYGITSLKIFDTFSKNWVKKNSSPYFKEISELAELYKKPGIWFLNVSFEWGCTCLVASDSKTGYMQILRVLDWPLEGLGVGLVAVHQDGPAGVYLNFTWPGFVGVVTGVAKGRFAAAINQAPMPSFGLGFYGDWLVGRIRIGRSHAMPAMHLLRYVFENAQNYKTANHQLTTTPIAVPCIITLAGTEPGEGCIIEHTGNRVHIHPAPVTAANHWLTEGLEGHERGNKSRERANLIGKTNHFSKNILFDWLKPPILNETTRFAGIMNPKTGKIFVQGFEREGVATSPLSINL